MTTFRTGIGYDLHRTAPDRTLKLGGVSIPAPFGLLGHSDADVVLHAVCDAVLGAAGLGDIGEMFPDTDETWRDSDSRTFVPDVLARARAAGWTPANIDVVIIAQAPRLTSHKPTIQASLAALWKLDESAVGVKATTNEGLDAIGRGEAIACLATTLLVPTGQA